MNDEYDQYDTYECFKCAKAFSKRIWSVTRAFTRMHYDSAVPECEVTSAEELAEYCCEGCMVLHLPTVMAAEGVPIPAVPPGSGPVESCAICGGLVDMATFHLTYMNEQAIQVSAMVIQPEWGSDIAVVCNTCRKPGRATTYEEPKVESSRAAPAAAHLGSGFRIASLVPA